MEGSGNRQDMSIFGGETVRARSIDQAEPPASMQMGFAAASVATSIPLVTNRNSSGPVVPRR